MFNTLNISFYSFCHYKTTRSVFLPTAADPSRSFRMTLNALLIMTPYNPPSFSTFSCQLTAHS